MVVNILISFGQKIRKVRINKGITQEQLAELSGLHRTYLGSVERGERNISLINIFKIAKALEVEIKELLQDNE